MSINSEIRNLGITNSKSNRMCIPVGDPVDLTIPTYDGMNQPVHPSVVFIPDGLNGYKYWMAMTPYTRGNSAVENPSIVASNDGTNWVVPAGLNNPVVPAITGGYNRDAELIHIVDNNTNKLRLYWGNSKGKGYYKESLNGVDWGSEVEINGGAFSATQSTVIRDGAGVFHAYSQPVGIFANNRGNLGSYTSRDGVAWNADEPIMTNLLGKVWHIGSLNDGCGYHFIACVYPADKTMATMDLYYGYSEDGRHIMFDNAPIVQTADFFDSHLYKGCIIQSPRNQIYRIYFSYRRIENGVWGIGYQDVIVNSRVKYESPENVRVTLWKDLSIRDTAIHYATSVGTADIAIPELSEYKHKAIMIRNNTGGILELSIRSMLRGTNLWNPIYDMGEGKPATFNIPNSEAMLIDERSWKILGNCIPFVSELCIKASTAPTSGTVSAEMLCWND